MNDYMCIILIYWHLVMCINSHLETYLVIILTILVIIIDIICLYLWQFNVSILRKTHFLAIWCLLFWRKSPFWHFVNFGEKTSFWQNCHFGSFDQNRRSLFHQNANFDKNRDSHFFRQHGDARKPHGSDSCHDGDITSDHAWIIAAQFFLRSDPYSQATQAEMS